MDNYMKSKLARQIEIVDVQVPANNNTTSKKNLKGKKPGNAEAAPSPKKILMPPTKKPILFLEKQSQSLDLAIPTGKAKDRIKKMTKLDQMELMQ